MHLLSITLHMGVTLKSQYLFVVGAKQFAVNRMSNAKVSIVFSEYFKLLAGSVYIYNIQGSIYSIKPNLVEIYVIT